MDGRFRFVARLHNGEKMASMCRGNGYEYHGQERKDSVTDGWNGYCVVALLGYLTMYLAILHNFRLSRGYHKRLEAYFKLGILRLTFKAQTCIQTVIGPPCSHFFVG